MARSLLRSSLLCLILLILTPPAISADNITVVSSDQDYDVAKLVSDSLGAKLVVTKWGKLTAEDAQDILSGKPGKLIIIGGPYSVPREIESLGIRQERVGGENRVETARIALKRFFQAEPRAYVLPSEEAVREYVSSSRDRTAFFILGNSTVSQRWGRYHAAKFADYFKDSKVLPSAQRYFSDGTITAIAVGNVGNNDFIARAWPDSLPLELTYFPLVYLKREDGSDTLFIVGSDQNLFYTQRAFENMGLKSLKRRDFLAFFALTSLLIAFAIRSTRSRFALATLIAFGLTFILLEVRRIPASYLSWDSLYVYFDGALALDFLGRYETILTGRSSPGTSFLTYLYFGLTSPTDVNGEMLMILMALAILVFCYTLRAGSSNEWNGLVLIFLLYTNPYFRDRIPIFASDIPFAAFNLMALVSLSRQTIRWTALSGLLIGFSSAIRPSGLLLFPAAVAYLMYKKQAREASVLMASLLFSFLAIQLLAPTIGVIGAYSTEIFLKRQNPSPMDFVFDAKQVLYFFVVTMGVTLAPGLLTNKYSSRFDSIVLLYILLHLTGLVFWIDISARYVFPVMPAAAILAVNGIDRLQSHMLRTALPLSAAIINLYMLTTGYRFPGII